MACQQSEGQPFSQAPWASTKHSVRLRPRRWCGAPASSTSTWAAFPAGPVRPPQGVDAGSGQTNINGWTVQFDETSTRFTYDATGHGMSVEPGVHPLLLTSPDDGVEHD